MCNSCNSCTCGSSLWGCGYQRLCRDRCGNIRVSNCGSNYSCGSYYGAVSATNGSSVSTCGCQSGCGCQSSCGCQSGTAYTADAYYARQYGLYGYSGCPCGSGYTYDTVTQTTT